MVTGRNTNRFCGQRPDRTSVESKVKGKPANDLRQLTPKRELGGMMVPSSLFVRSDYLAWPLRWVETQLLQHAQVVHILPAFH